jgi:hypothetical protein
MRSQLFIGSAFVVLLVIVGVALAGVFTKPQPTITPEPVKVAQPRTQEPCCTEQNCCPECLACCAEDGCCWECILCCIEMGCDPACCFPSSTSVTSEAPKKGEVRCTADGCSK